MAEDNWRKDRSEYLSKNLKITTYEDNKPYAFISYAGKEWEKVFTEIVVPLQREYGMNTYCDKEFESEGHKWLDPMVDNMREAAVVIAFVSKMYITRYACLLELMNAVVNNKNILFVILDDYQNSKKSNDYVSMKTEEKDLFISRGALLEPADNSYKIAMKFAYNNTILPSILQRDNFQNRAVNNAFMEFFKRVLIAEKKPEEIKLSAIKESIDSYTKAAQISVFVPELVKKLAENNENISTEPPAETIGEPDPVPVSSAAEASAEIKENPPIDQPTSSAAKSQSETGTICYDDGSVYEGELLNGSPNGQGKLIKTDGKTYEGVFYGSADKGKGKITYSATKEYTGEWSNGEPNGQGTMEYTNKKNYFKGNFINGSLNGDDCEVKYDNGKDPSSKPLYTGTFRDGKPQHCTVKYPNGTIYIGDLEDWQPNGQGAMTKNLENGKTAVYNGNFKNGKLCDSKGVLTYYNESGEEAGRYVGNFENDIINGECDYFTSSKKGSNYHGNWKDGKRCGHGVLTFSDGRVYNGNFSDNKQNGQGTLTDKYGKTIHSGIWENGKFIG